LHLGQTSQLKTQNKEISNQKTLYDKQIIDIKNELNAVLNNQGQLLETIEKDFKKSDLSIYSPLLENKQLEISTYKYKTKNIVRKRIIINDHSGIDFWEYTSGYNTFDGPKNFVIFSGYENYTNAATVVDDIKKTWQDTYKTKNGIDMYYQYEYTPKTIGVILLDSYFDYFPGYEYSKPAFIQIWYSINGTALSKNDSFVLEAKKELNKIADSFKLVKPDP